MTERKPNDNRSDTKNPNNRRHAADMKNREKLRKQNLKKNEEDKNK